MRLLAAAALALAMSFPAVAGPACQFVLPETTTQLDAQGIKYQVLDAEKRAEFLSALAAAVALKTGGPEPDLSKVTDVLLAVLEGELFFGLVIDRCLTAPQPLAAFLPPEQRSGWTPVGIFA